MIRSDHRANFYGSKLAMIIDPSSSKYVGRVLSFGSTDSWYALLFSLAFLLTFKTSKKKKCHWLVRIWAKNGTIVLEQPGSMGQDGIIVLEEPGSISCREIRSVSSSRRRNVRVFRTVGAQTRGATSNCIDNYYKSNTSSLVLASEFIDIPKSGAPLIVFPSTLEYTKLPSPVS